MRRPEVSPTVEGRCSTCAARWPTQTPRSLCLVEWTPEVVGGRLGEKPSIYRMVRHSRADSDINRTPGAARTTPALWPLERGERLTIVCPRCRVEHRVRASTLVDMATRARRERASEFLLP